LAQYQHTQNERTPNGRGERAHATNAAPRVLGQRLIDTAKQQQRDLLEFEAKALLLEHGIQVPTERVAVSADELTQIAAEFGQQPLAMKVVSKDILHKSDAGGVMLNLRGEVELRAAYHTIMGAAHAYNAQANIEGVLVTPMAEKGVEVIIGMLRDPIFGPVLMFGLGGIFVEVLEDVAFRALPMTRSNAVSMVAQIKAQKVLKGVRGAAAIDNNALVELLMRVAHIVEAYPAIKELDLNPVVLYPADHAQPYAIVDARIIVEREQ
ncbi:MAG: CoA-binding protein, partial [Gammaproteobacteria bacterium]|nr:CoA-binding protein [Gammaproteobacteria bacterium]